MPLSRRQILFRRRVVVFSAAGVLVLAVGAGLSLLAYRVMVRIGRLPDEERVLR